MTEEEIEELENDITDMIYDKAKGMSTENKLDLYTSIRDSLDNLIDDL